MLEPSNQDQLNEIEWKKKANWKAGLFYFSHKDSRLWVPKRSTLGWGRVGGTPNLAKPGARLYILVVMGIMLLLFFVVIALEKTGILN